VEKWYASLFGHVAIGSRLDENNYLQASGWLSAKDKVSGDTYYYHKETRNVSWDPPPGMDYYFCML
jgi:hypothetical protein